MNDLRIAPAVLLAALAVPAATSLGAPPKAPKAAPPPAAPAFPATPPAAQLAALKARPIGPAVMGGRVVSIAVDPDDPATFYLGHATAASGRRRTAGRPSRP